MWHSGTSRPCLHANSSFYKCSCQINEGNIIGVRRMSQPRIVWKAFRSCFHLLKLQRASKLLTIAQAEEPLGCHVNWGKRCERYAKIMVLSERDSWYSSSGHPYTASLFLALKCRSSHFETRKLCPENISHSLCREIPMPQASRTCKLSHIHVTWFSENTFRQHYSV